MTEPWEARPDGAVFSADRSYRYVLWRTWRPAERRVLFIGLNPSTADERADDPTIRRCIGFARAWDYGGLLVGNLFARCATQPARLKAALDPVGEENDAWLQTLVSGADSVLACWGRQGAYLDRDRQCAARWPGLLCLGTNRDGTPAHPLYMRRDCQPRPWPPDGGQPTRSRRMTMASSRPFAA